MIEAYWEMVIDNVVVIDIDRKIHIYPQSLFTPIYENNWPREMVVKRLAEFLPKQKAEKFEEAIFEKWIMKNKQND